MQQPIGDDQRGRGGRSPQTRRGDAWFRALLERSSEIILVTDADGMLTYVSPGARAALGWAPADAEGAALLDLITEEDRDDLVSAFSELLNTRGVASEVELRFNHADGGFRLLCANMRNLLDDPEIGGVLLNARDITESRHVEEQLRHSQKMEAVGRLAGGVAHDFNNILTAINGFAELVLESLEAGDARRDDVDEILRAAQRGAGLSRQLLAFSRRDASRARAVDLNEVVHEAEGMLRPLLGSDIDLQLDLADDLAAVHIDPVQMHQVILNLALNARDAMPDGGRITLRTAWANAAAEQGGGRRLLISVSDEGAGMSPEVLQRVFEPFFTTKSATEGTGLGLSTVYGIVRQAGGHVWVYSEPEQGSVFKIYLPPADAALAKPEAVAGSTEKTGTRGKRILIVEDDDAIRPLVARILRRSGYDVTEACSGDEGIVAASRAPVDLIVSDVVMPSMGGPEMVRRVREKYPAVPALFLSGYSAAEVASRGTLDAPFLEKPFESNELLKAVVEALR